MSEKKEKKPAHKVILLKIRLMLYMLFNDHRKEGLYSSIVLLLKVIEEMIIPDNELDKAIEELEDLMQQHEENLSQEDSVKMLEAFRKTLAAVNTS